MTGGKILDNIKIELRNYQTGDTIFVDISIFDNSLSRKWLTALNELLEKNYHLEKNYCFLGFSQSQRNGSFILAQVNQCIDAINQADLGYVIKDKFTMGNTMTDNVIDHHAMGRNIIHSRFNLLHRYFEDLQGVSGHMSQYYNKADATVRWHIRQLNLLCHEFESWALSYRKELEAPDWMRFSQLMCWLNAPRFNLDADDYQLFGIDTLNRPLGGVYVGVNKAIGKHHWEVFNDEGKDSRLHELTTTSMRSQTEAAGDFDIEWGRNPGEYQWQKAKLQEFTQWLIDNDFDPNDKSLTIGHPQIGQVDLIRSFGTDDHKVIWNILNTYLDVQSVATSHAQATYNYHWSDNDFAQRQIDIIFKGTV